MADAQFSEGRSFNLHTAGTDNVEGSAIAVASASGALAVGGDANGLNVHLLDAAGTAINVGTVADATSAAAALVTKTFVELYNGTTYDRARSAPGVTGFLGIGGSTASDAAIASAPVTIGGRASNAV